MSTGPWGRSPRPKAAISTESWRQCLLSGRLSGPLRCEVVRFGFDPRLAGSLSIGCRDLASKHPIGMAKVGKNHRQQDNEACSDKFRRGPICRRRPDGGLTRYYVGPETNRSPKPKRKSTMPSRNVWSSRADHKPRQSRTITTTEANGSNARGNTCGQENQRCATSGSARAV